MSAPDLPSTPAPPDPEVPSVLTRALWRSRSMTARTARAVLPPAVLHRVEPFVRAQERRWWRGGRDGVGWAVRLAGAAAAGYLVARLLLPGSTPLVAALTAMLVVQLTPVSLLTNGALRIVAVLSGVAIAAVFAATVPLSWWSIALAVGVAALVGQLLRLGDNIIEVPISTLLVLSAGQFGYGSAASHRVVESLLGAAVGIVITMVVPPRIVSDDAGKAVAEVADGLSDLLLRSSWELIDVDDVPTTARAWVGEARVLTRWLPGAVRAVETARESRRLNLRALALVDTGPGLRQGVVSIEASLVTVRSTYRSLLDVVDGTTWDVDELSEEVKASTAMVLREASVAVGAFGDLVEAQARRPDIGRPAPLSRIAPRQRARRRPFDRPVPPASPAQPLGDAPAALREREALRVGLAGLRDARVRLTELVLVDRSDFAELNVTLLACVRRLLVELDLDHRDRVMSTPPGQGLPRLVERRAQGRLPEPEAAPGTEPEPEPGTEPGPVRFPVSGPARDLAADLGPTESLDAGGGPARAGRAVRTMVRRSTALRRRATPRLSPPGASGPTGPHTPGPASREG